MIRITNSLLIATIIVGVGMLVRQHAFVRDLRTERNRLGAKYGILSIKDPSKFYVRRIETDEPTTNFCWRIYCPAGVSTQHATVWGIGESSSGTGGTKGEGEFVFRCRFVLDNGALELHSLRTNGSERTNFGDPELAKFVVEHWDELTVEPIADGAYGKEEVLSFLTVRIPPPLLDEYQSQHPGKYEPLGQKPFFQSTYGSQQAFEEEEQATPE